MPRHFPSTEQDPPKSADYAAAGKSSQAPARSYSSHRSRRTARHRASSAGHAQPNKPVIIAVICAVVLALTAIAVFVIAPFFASSAEEELVYEQVIVTVPDGSGVLQIQALLVEANVVSDDNEFYARVMERGEETNLKSGTYEFTTYSDVDDVIDQLVEGPNTTYNRLTLPEGLTVSETAALVESSLGISADVFLEQAKASNYASEYSFLADAQNDSLEGFLYPKTYDFSGQEITADLVIRTMLDQYETELASYDFEAAAEAILERYGIEMSEYDFITLASIIEWEAVTDDDRTLVSSVFYNRLSLGMALQSDATMSYVTGSAVTASDLSIESEYNTYLNLGLTPTPVCSPSIESIQAALEPSDTSYLYFYIVEDGVTSVHAFSETYAQHLAVIEEYS